MMENEELKQYKEAILKGENLAKVAQEDQLSDKLDADDDLVDACLNLSDENYLTSAFSERREIEEQKQTNLRRLSNEMDRRMKKRRLKIRLGAISTSVAAAILAISFLLNTNETSNDGSLSENNGSQEVARPVLILENGSSINLSLSDTINDIVSNVIDMNNPSGMENPMETVTYNTIVIPEKCSYTIRLSDSSVVFLNANSTFRFPTKFNGDSRKVFLQGGAYFKINKSKKPFIINSSDVEVKVYGTEFNVDAYNPLMIKTALIRGSVGVTFNHTETMLTPNQMSTVDVNGNSNKVTQINPEKYKAWLEGYFRFENDRFEDIVTEIGHWYNVKFRIETEGYRDVVMTGAFQKSSSLDEILSTIKESVDFNWDVKNGGEYVIK